MIITNRHGLPQAFVDAVTKNLHEYVPGRYSVTEILNPVQEILLTREHCNQIQRDASEFIPQVFGSALHDYLARLDASGQSEQRLSVVVRDGFVLSGQYDLFDAETLTLTDYKTASVWKVVHEDYEDYRRQGLMYAWLLHCAGKHVERCVFHIFLKDWSDAESERHADYPPEGIVTYAFQVTASGLREIEQFIHDRADALTSRTMLSCTASERWNTGDKFAAMKNGRKTAVRVCDSMAEAQAVGGDYVDVRPGIDKKCNKYCLAAPWCTQHRAIVTADTTVATVLDAQPSGAEKEN